MYAFCIDIMARVFCGIKKRLKDAPKVRVKYYSISFGKERERGEREREREEGESERRRREKRKRETERNSIFIRRSEMMFFKAYIQ